MIFARNLRKKYKKREFPNLVSYTRFIELRQKLFLPTLIFAKLSCKKCSGVSVIDFVSLATAHIKRAYNAKFLKTLRVKEKQVSVCFLSLNCM